MCQETDPDPSYRSLLTTSICISMILLLRDGMDSVNLVAMYDVAGQESWNFFANTFTAHIPDISGPLVFLGAKFYTATNNIRQASW